MALPTPLALSNVLTSGINSVGTLSQQVLSALTQMQVSAIRSIAAATPQLPSFSTGQRGGAMSIQLPKIERVFSAVPEAVSRAFPTGQTKGITRNHRQAGKTALF